MKDNFFLPAIIFVVAVGLIAAYMFVVQNGYAASRFIDLDYSEVYRGLLVNSYGATNGLIVQNGNVGIGTTNLGIFKLSVNGQIRANDLIGSGNLRIAGSGNDKHVAILGGGGSSPSENEGAAIYVRGG